MAAGGRPRALPGSDLLLPSHARFHPIGRVRRNSDAKPLGRRLQQRGASEISPIQRDAFWKVVLEPSSSVHGLDPFAIGRRVRAVPPEDAGDPATAND